MRSSCSGGGGAAADLDKEARKASGEKAKGSERKLRKLSRNLSKEKKLKKLKKEEKIKKKERRMDGEDGPFTKREFVEFYGGTIDAGPGVDRWNKAGGAGAGGAGGEDGRKADGKADGKAD
eukprot:CAMPEP_0198549436 /NCGR_PEP_ID=MMETSP1462-20131121/72799_1 /TAXON_ID=1333877 /ORGANISM="Brandtodinium nutriculum, Strain RCC3387" /LENGTH=120 /DNA_ID=CAMNT_0044280013 /DNA_START=1 /DNA_END=360 /DNA_ORIENTATION=-